MSMIIQINVCIHKQKYSYNCMYTQIQILISTYLYTNIIVQKHVFYLKCSI